MKKGYWAKNEYGTLHYYEEFENNFTFSLCARSNSIIPTPVSPLEAETSTNKCKICEKIKSKKTPTSTLS